MATASPKTKRKRPNTGSATRRGSPQKRGSTDTPLFNGSHVSGFVVGLLVGVIASLGIVGGVNPSALPQAVKTATQMAKMTIGSQALPFYNARRRIFLGEYSEGINTERIQIHAIRASSRFI